MFDQKKIQQISKQSKAEKWAFPRTANALRAVGVDYYLVDLPTAQIIYHGEGKSFSEPFPFTFQAPSIKQNLDSVALKKAIIKHQKEKTSYQDFLHDIALAGVKNYRADMLKEEVIYYGKNNQENHVEKISQQK